MSPAQIYDNALAAWRKPRERSLTQTEAALAQVCGAVASMCRPLMRDCVRPMGWVTDSVAIILSDHSKTFPINRFYSASSREEGARA